MNGAAARRKGHEAECAVVRLLRSYGYADAVTARDATHGDGSRQLFDVLGVPGRGLEVKNRQQLSIGAALASLEALCAPEDVRPLLIVKPTGVGMSSVSRWWAIKYLGQEIEEWDR